MRGQRGADHELIQRLPAVDERPHRLVSALLAQVARVQALGVHGHIGLRQERLVQRKGLERGVLSGLVAIEREHHARGGGPHLELRPRDVPHEPPHHLDVLLAKGRAASRHGGRHPREVARHHIGIALDHHHLPLLPDRGLGQVQPVEHLGLLVQGRFGGVEVLGALVVVVEPARAKADHLARHVADRPHQAPAEAVVDLARLPLGDQARCSQFRLGEALGAQVVGQVGPALGRIADAELLGDVSPEAALQQEVAPDLGLGGAQLRGIELGRHPMGVEQALALARGALGPRPPACLVAQRHAGTRGKILHGLLEGQPVELHDEGDDVSSLAAAEAVIAALRGAHVEGGRTLVVEGAQALERPHARGFERHMRADDLVNGGALAYRRDVLTVDHARHGSTLGRVETVRGR